MIVGWSSTERLKIKRILAELLLQLQPIGKSLKNILLWNHPAKLIKVWRNDLWMVLNKNRRNEVDPCITLKNSGCHIKIVKDLLWNNWPDLIKLCRNDHWFVLNKSSHNEVEPCRDVVAIATDRKIFCSENTGKNLIKFHRNDPWLVLSKIGVKLKQILAELWLPQQPKLKYLKVVTSETTWTNYININRYDQSMVGPQ